MCRLSFNDIYISYRPANSALSDFRVIYITSPDQIHQLEQLRETASEKQSVLLLSLKVLRSLSELAHKLAFDSVFSQIGTHLHQLADMEVCVTSRISSPSLVSRHGSMIFIPTALKEIMTLLTFRGF